MNWENWTKYIGMNLINEVTITIGDKVQTITGEDMVKKQIEKLFNELGDKKDLFKETKYMNIGDNFICYKELNEYGLSIKICENNGEEIFNIFLDKDDNKNNIVTSFYCNKTNKGLNEKILSNRTEYYIDGKYEGTEKDDNIDNIIKNNTKMILEDKKYPTLYKFIVRNNMKIILIPKTEFNL